MIQQHEISKILFLNFIVLIAILSFGTFTHAENSSQQSSALTKVDSKYVCMITDQEFAREQIPVELEGKTYYGCCEMCKAKIKNNPQSRLGTDPVSGNNVDKAEAVIGAAPDGKVFYFESEENLSQFDPSSVN
jgi:YHS domain-containing protein